MARCSWRGQRFVPVVVRRAVRPGQRHVDRHRGHGFGGVVRRSATLLLDGRVLVTGAQRDPELYDPGTRSWTPFWTMLRPHDAAPATLLLDGRVLVAGGKAVRNRRVRDNALSRAVRPGRDSTGSPPPTLTPTPAPTPTPTPVPPQAVVLPDARTWKVTVSNKSSEPRSCSWRRRTSRASSGGWSGPRPRTSCHPAQP